MQKIFLALLLCVFATSAGASTVTGTGQTFTINFNGVTDTSSGSNQVVAGLSATAVFTVTSFNTSTNTIGLSILLTNTSGTPFTSARVSSIGFDTNPSLASATSSGLFTKAVLNSAYPTGFGAIDFCAISNPGNSSNCQGGASGGVTIGQSGTVTLSLTFNSSIAGGVDLSNFGVRYQSLSSPSTSGSGVGYGTPPIPEPTSMAVFGLGALIVGAALRKRARA